MKSRRSSAARPARSHAPGVRAKFWLTFGPRTLFGDGKATLLAEVDRKGSLRAAAAVMGMSYRHAWGLLRELEQAAGFALLEHEGEGVRTPLRLTPRGRRLLADWREFRASLDRLVEQRFRRVFARQLT